MGTKSPPTSLLSIINISRLEGSQEQLFGDIKGITSHRRTSRKASSFLLSASFPDPPGFRSQLDAGHCSVSIGAGKDRAHPCGEPCLLPCSSGRCCLCCAWHTRHMGEARPFSVLWGEYLKASLPRFFFLVFGMRSREPSLVIVQENKAPF